MAVSQWQVRQYPFCACRIRGPYGFAPFMTALPAEILCLIWEDKRSGILT